MSNLANNSSGATVAPTPLAAEAKQPIGNSDSNNNMNDSSKASKTPKRPRKRPSEVVDSSLVIETPPGLDNNRRQTRSVTRGTPAPAPKPAPAAKKERKTPAPKKARVEAKGKAEKMETSSGGDEIANAAEKVTEVKKDDKLHGAVVPKLKEAEEKKGEPIKPSQSISPEKPAAASPAKVETTPTAKVVEKKEVVADVAPALPIPAPVAASISPSLRSPSDKLGAKTSEPSKPIVQNNNSSPEKQAIPVETVSAAAAAATVAPTSNNVAPVAIANHDKV